ncbi:MAG: hypothetical protein K6U11_11730 [bacterium]|nr:hypothetical protein [bacterium]
MSIIREHRNPNNFTSGFLISRERRHTEITWPFTENGHERYKKSWNIKGGENNLYSNPKIKFHIFDVKVFHKSNSSGGKKDEGNFQNLVGQFVHALSDSSSSRKYIDLERKRSPRWYRFS